jgi:predicted O-methyltransferase YrrM
MNQTLTYILEKFKPTIAPRGGTEIHGINRTIMTKLLKELNFKVGAEIGVAEGFHAKMICENNPDVKLHAVDIWKKYEGYEEYADPEQCFQNAKKLLKPYDVVFHKQFSMDAVKNFENNTLDFVYIDGAHDFKNVADDVCEWAKKVKVGGIVFGHDYKRSSHRSRFKVDVKDVIDAYMYAHRIMPWFVLTNDIKDPKFGPDNPGWCFVRQESDEI